MTTGSSEIYVPLADSDDATTRLRLPSFLYIENKVEEIENTLSMLFDMPKSGEAWFTRSNDMYKLTMLRANTAPQRPKISETLEEAVGGTYSTQNTFLKDLVTPRVSIRVKLDNLTDNIDRVLMRKYVFYNEDAANYIQGFKTYEGYEGALYGMSKGSDYDVYESEVKMPIKRDKYISEFKILEIPQYDNEPNPTATGEDGNLVYTVRLNTLYYYDKDNNALQFTLRAGDLLTHETNYTIYKVLKVSSAKNSTTDDIDHIIEIEEIKGHTALQTTEENSLMTLKIYAQDYSEYDYVDVPLEENSRIAIMLATVYNNIRSEWSNALYLDLNNIYMKNPDGSDMLINGKRITYMDYYNQYCINLGDLLAGFARAAQPQLEDFTPSQLYELTNNPDIKTGVDNTLKKSDSSILNVTRINRHLIDSSTADEIRAMYTQKVELQSQLRIVNDNISQTYNQLVNTDFSQEISVTQESLKSQLNEYYNERSNIQSQLINVIDSINIQKTSVEGTSDAKYRIRGVTQIDEFERYLKEHYGKRCTISAMIVEYKYRSTALPTTSLESNANVVFTDWNRQVSYPRNRELVFNEDYSDFNIVYENIVNETNAIKWNQIDIPINQGEDVIVRIKYKYAIGEPFIELYTPWSEEQPVVFPAEFVGSTEISDIFADNDNDVASTQFMRTLVSEGYQEHILNKLIDNSQIFYHQPENIYSGFMNDSSKMLSLKDYLNQLTTELDAYKTLIENELQSDFKVYIQYDNNTIELNKNGVSHIRINAINTEATDTFVKKKFNLIIKNTGSTAIKLYSIFPGPVEQPLISSDMEFYSRYIIDYERVPLLLEGAIKREDSVYMQTLGQWIYFRENNPYNYNNIYMKDLSYLQDQRNLDVQAVSLGNNNLSWNLNYNLYISKDNSQAILGYRQRSDKNDLTVVNSTLRWSTLNRDMSIDVPVYTSISSSSQELYEKYVDSDESLYMYQEIYENTTSNKWVMKYEHFLGKSNDSEAALIYLSQEDSLEKFYTQNMFNNTSGVSSLEGAFLVPELLSDNALRCDTTLKNQYKNLGIGESLTIPVLYEYYISPSHNNTVSIKKSLSFDLRPSLLQNPINFTVEVTAYANYTQNVIDASDENTLYDELVS